MIIIIKTLEGTELLNVEFSSISVKDKLYSFNFNTNALINLNLDTDKIYNISFLNAEEVGLSDAMTMVYISYYYNASTAFVKNEEGETISTVAVNSNTITLKKY